MVDSELSLIRFCTLNFFGVVITSRPFQPISTLLVKLVEALISAESEPDKKNMSRLKWIYENTHEEVNQPLAIIELAVFKNLDRGLNREIEIGEKSYYLIHLYKYLDEITKELSTMVIEISKKYSIDLPMSAYTGGSMQRINMDDDK